MHVSDWFERRKEPQVDAFIDLRDALADPKILVAPRKGAGKRLITDASDIGFGAVLMQLEDGDEWRPVAFENRKLRGAEVRHTVTDREAGAVAFALRRFRHDLDGEEFSVVTDHAALKWLLSLSDPIPRLARYIIAVQDLAFTVEHAPGNGEVLVVPDALSRDTFPRESSICQRSLKLIACVEEEESLTVQKLLDEQLKEYKDLSSVADSKEWLISEEGLLVRADKHAERVVVPPSMRDAIIAR